MRKTCFLQSRFDGIDIFVAKKVAAAFGLEAVAVKLAWSGLIEALNARQIDCIIAGMTPTDEAMRAIRGRAPGDPLG